MTEGMTLPINLESENAVLGAIILDNDAYKKVSESLNFDDFSSEKNRRIFQAMQMCVAQGESIEYLNISNKLDSRTIPGVMSYLAELTSYWGTGEMVRASNVGNYIEAVKKASILRKCALTAHAISESACNPQATPKEVQDRLEKLLSDVNAATTGRCPDYLFVPSTQFISTIPEHIDWLVEGILQRGANGFFCAIPKAGKSWAAADMAISLALGCDWLDFRVPRPARVAMISREDAPGLTAWRITQLVKAKAKGFTDSVVPLLKDNLYINSRQQSDDLMLSNPEHVADLISAMLRRRIEFAIFDVFNVLHAADENDNQEMREVLRQLSNIQKEVGCGIGVVHHFNKAGDGSMTQRLRGSSAIAGWAEWLIGISMADEESKIRRMEFELKAAQPPSPIYYKIESYGNSAELVRRDPPGQVVSGNGKNKFMQ